MHVHRGVNGTVLRNHDMVGDTGLIVEDCRAMIWCIVLHTAFVESR